MAFFKARVGGKDYQLDKLTLGEIRILKKQFGLRDMTELDGRDIEVIIGLLFLSSRRIDPTRPDAEILAEVESLDIETFEISADEALPVETEPEPEPEPEVTPAS